VLMENAGRSLAEATLPRAGSRPKVLVVAGPGSNGGDGFVAARHIANAGVRVGVVTLGGPAEGSDAGVNLRAIEAMRLPLADGSGGASQAIERVVKRLGGCSCVIDAVFGTGLSRAPEGAMAEAIRTIVLLGDRGAEVVAADVPSGLDADTGEALGDCVRADLTVSFACRKIGFQSPSAFAYLGEVVIGEIGAPAALAEELAREAAPVENGGS
jgi:ADP-dependent NAD(P)H-hydrate dehydratase / NAD(P)H-hydrate epimerase